MPLKFLELLGEGVMFIAIYLGLMWLVIVWSKRK